MERRQLIISIATIMVVLVSLVLIAMPPDKGKGAAVLASPDMGPNFGISTSSSRQEESAIAYSKDSNQYLVVWQDWRNGPSWIYGQMVSGAASLIGPNFPIPSVGVTTTVTNTKQFLPAVAYNEVSKSFLVVWEDERDFADSSTNVYSSVVTGTNSMSPSDVRLTDAFSDQKRPRLACNSLNGDCLVVWQDRRNAGSSDTDVWGQLVAADGTLKGSNFPIVEGAGKQMGPTVAFDSLQGRYLVTWFDFNGGTGGDCTGGECDIRGQLIQVDGNPFGSSFSISSAPNDQKRPVAAFNSTGNEFLVIWYDMRNGTGIAEIYGQRVGGSGSLTGGNVLLATGTDNQYSPSIVYDPVNNDYRMFWYSLPSGSTQSTVFSTIVSPEGVVVGGNATVSTTGYYPTQPMIAYNSTTGEFLGTWCDGRSFVTTGVDVYAQRLSTEAEPVPTATSTATSTATATPSPVALPTETNTPLPQPTAAASPAATSTPQAQATAIASATATAATATETVTAEPTATSNVAATATPTVMATASPTPLPTDSPTPQPTAAPSPTATIAPTSTPEGQGPLKIVLPFLPKGGS